MNIVLIGYGKMGHAIEQAAEKRGHTIIARITSQNKQELNAETMSKADAAIEFTSPDSAYDNVKTCLEAGLNVVSGTTGWNEEVMEAQAKALEVNGGFLHSSNFSVGVNIFFEVNKLLSKLMNGHSEYAVVIEETHHTQKRMLQAVQP